MAPITTAFELQEVASLAYWQSPNLKAQPGLFHLFTSRRGGVSPPPYESWNLGMSVADLPANVDANRQVLHELLPAPAGEFVTARQVHGNVAVALDSHPGESPRADALLTDRPGLPLMLSFADCVPVLGYDPITRSAAIIHAGWRGTAAAITGAAIAVWGKAYGARPAHLLLAIGPAIGRCCYHLPPANVSDLLATVPDTPPELLAGPMPDNPNHHVDLAEINRRQAIAAGVPAGQIVLSAICTACSPQLAFSYRRDGPESGRMAAVIMLRG